MYVYEAHIITAVDLIAEDLREKEAQDTADFEGTYKDQAVGVDGLGANKDLVFSVNKTYDEFKTLVVDPLTWANVNYLHDGFKYILFLMVNTDVDVLEVDASHFTINTTNEIVTNGSQKTQLVGPDGLEIAAVTNKALDVNLKNDIPLKVSLANADASVAVYGSDGVANYPLKTDNRGELQVDVLTSPLPVGASTSALQLLGNSSVASVDTKLTDKTQFTKLTDGTDTALITTAGEQQVADTTVATLNNGIETTVAGTAVQLIGVNASRKMLIIQNTGAANMRVGTTGVSATTGFRLAAGDSITFTPPYIPTNAIFAIREGLISTIGLAQEAT